MASRFRRKKRTKKSVDCFSFTSASDGYFRFWGTGESFRHQRRDKRAKSSQTQPTINCSLIAACGRQWTRFNPGRARRVCCLYAIPAKSTAQPELSSPRRKGKKSNKNAASGSRLRLISLSIVSDRQSRYHVNRMLTFVLFLFNLQ